MKLKIEAEVDLKYEPAENVEDPRLLEVIREMKKNKLPGEDNITVELIKNGIPKLISII